MVVGMVLNELECPLQVVTSCVWCSWMKSWAMKYGGQVVAHSARAPLNVTGKYQYHKM